MDTPDFQFIDAQMAQGNFFLPETAYDLTNYAHQLGIGDGLMASMNADEVKDLFVNTVADSISSIESQHELQREVLQKVQESADIESKGEDSNDENDEDMAVMNESRETQANDARDLALMYIAMVRHVGNDATAIEYVNAALQLLADVRVSAEEPLNEQPAFEESVQADGSVHDEESGHLDLHLDESSAPDDSTDTDDGINTGSLPGAGFGFSGGEFTFH